jgi:uncharacterized OB-fold protein
MSTLDAFTAVAPVRDGLFTDEALIGGRCENCGMLQFPRREVCPACQHGLVAEVALPVNGVIFTFTIVRAAPPGYLGEIPYAYGVVELAGGLRVTATILADDLGTIRIGDSVAFDLIRLSGGDQPVSSFAYRLTKERKR